MNNEDFYKLLQKHPKKMTRARAIKLYCKEMCSAGDLVSWKYCSFDNCFLWKFRTGKITLGNATSFKKGRKNKQNLENSNDLGIDTDNISNKGGVD